MYYFILIFVTKIENQVGVKSYARLTIELYMQCAGQRSKLDYDQILISSVGGYGQDNSRV